MSSTVVLLPAGTSIRLPVQVAADGTVTHHPQTSDPRETCVWVEGAASSLRPSIRRKHAERISDLREKERVLELKRPKFYGAGVDVGPRLRTAAFRALANTPPPADGSGPDEWFEGRL